VSELQTNPGVAYPFVKVYWSIGALSLEVGRCAAEPENVSGHSWRRSWQAASGRGETERSSVVSRASEVEGRIYEGRVLFPYMDMMYSHPRRTIGDKK
jgi:hypothetical protein